MNAPRTGTCPACGQTIAIVNYQPARNGLPEQGYLGRHQRPRTRPGSKCRGSFDYWVERKSS